MQILPNSKVADLLDSDPRLLTVLTRLSLRGSYGEKTIAELSAGAGLNPLSVSLLFRIYSNPEVAPTAEELGSLAISDILLYLHNSHSYYLSEALINIEQRIEQLIAPCSPAQKSSILHFLAGYKSELESHFVLEEERVIPYVEELLLGRSKPDFSIDSFEDHHSNADAKLSDLKRLIIKSLPQQCDDSQRDSLIRFLFWLQNDLRVHTQIEDEVLVPFARLLENPHRRSLSHRSAPELPSESNELSEREKQILVSVAKGLINKEIADLHHISINTVITHRRNITRKTGIKTVPGLTVYAILNDLIDINSIE